MRGSLVVIAALCVVAAEASSVRFVSPDDGLNSKDKAHRSEVSEGTDPAIQKKVKDLVKKINDGEEQLEKTVKSLDADRSSAGDKTPESAGEGVKKAASSEKSKVHKRDVMRALEQLAKRGMKKEEEEEVSIFSARKIIIKYLSLQKAVTGKITISLLHLVDELETDQKEKDALVKALKAFQKNMEEVYDKTINALGPSYLPVGESSGAQRKFVRAGDIPGLMTAMNQRNPLALIPLLTRLIGGIAGAASIADMATSFSGTRSSMPDVPPFADMIPRLLSKSNLPLIPDYE